MFCIRKNTLFFYGIYLFAAFFYFKHWLPHVFSQDDLTAFLAYKNHIFASNLHQALADGFCIKYRPIYGLTVFILCSLFGKNIVGYVLVNLIIQATNAILVYHISMELSGKKQLTSFLIGLIADLSRFALFQVFHPIIGGPLEGLALLFFLLTLYTLLRSRQSKKFQYSLVWLSIVFAVAAFNTHERYIIIVPWLAIALFLLPELRVLSKVKKFLLLAAMTILSMFNIIYKKMVLKMPFFVGTGGYLININPHQILQLSEQAVFSIFGVNTGPQYLVGAQSLSLHYPAWIFSFSVAMCLIFSIGYGLYTVITQKIAIQKILNDLQWPLLFLMLFCFLLLPPVLLIRMEQRWLFAPFIVLLLMVAYFTNKQRNCSQSFFSILVLVLCISSITNDLILSPYFKLMSFIGKEQYASAVKKFIIDKQKNSSADLAFIPNDDGCFFMQAQHGGFFKLYGGASRKVYCFQNMSVAKKNVHFNEIPIYTVVIGKKVIEVKPGSNGSNHK